MVLICESCKKKAKISRECVSLGIRICTTCCGTKRNKEIKCSDNCEYYIESIKRDNYTEVKNLVKTNFNEESSDIYNKSEVVKVVGPFENYVFNRYYMGNYRNDNFYDCYLKIYFSIEGKDKIYTYNDFEEDIKNKFDELTNEVGMSNETKKLIVLRLVKSIEAMSGRTLNNKGYMELLRGHFTYDGILSPMFDEDK